MNCHETRTVLDAVFPDARMDEDPHVQGAAAHARTCPDCSIWLSSTHAIDRWLAPAFRDAAVPSGLRDRVLASLNSSPVSTFAPPVRRTRRMWLASAAAAVAIAATVGFLNWDPKPEQATVLTMTDALQQLDTDRAAFNTLKSFDGNFTPVVPPRWKGWVSGSPLGIDLVAGSEHDAAVYRFKAGGYEGYLVVIAPERVSDPPSVGIPHESLASYPNQRVSWTSDGQLCVCYLDADGPKLEEFLRELNSQSA
jgi:hypothetical protein